MTVRFSRGIYGRINPPQSLGLIVFVVTISDLLGVIDLSNYILVLKGREMILWPILAYLLGSGFIGFGSLSNKVEHKAEIITDDVLKLKEKIIELEKGLSACETGRAQIRSEYAFLQAENRSLKEQVAEIIGKYAVFKNSIDLINKEKEDPSKK